jgi:hypothetical protein
MYVQNGDEPYQSATDAMRYWPVTATAVALRLREDGTCEIAAPLGHHDLFNSIIRPAGRFATEKCYLSRARQVQKLVEGLANAHAFGLSPSPPVKVT